MIALKERRCDPAEDTAMMSHIFDPGKTWLGDSTMTDAKDFLPSSFRIGQVVKSAALAAVIGTAALIPMTASAQSTPPAMPAVYSGDTQNTNIIIPVVYATAMGEEPGVDYRILADPHYDYAQIVRARSYGMTDKEIVRAIDLADKANVPTSQILDNIHDGWTFSTIATNYGVSFKWQDEDDTDKLNNYLAAYRATGRFALRYADNDDNGGVVSKTLAYNDTITSPTMSDDVVHTLRSNPDFRTFSKALRRTGLDATLEGAGPYTVFAPSDAAFDAIPKDQLKSIWNNKAELTQVLEYHILPANISAAQAMAMTSPTSPATLEGDTLQVTSANSQVMVNGNLVTTPDIQASNGVIHELDAVLIPSSVQSTLGGPVQMTPPSPVPPPSGASSMNGGVTTTPDTAVPNNGTDNPTTTPDAALNPGVVTPGTNNPANTTPDTTLSNPQPATPNMALPPVTATPDNGTSTTSPNAINAPAPSVGASGVMNGTGTGPSTPATGGGNTGTVGSTTSGATQ